MESAFSSLSSLWPEKCSGPALLTTYTFNAPFFEMHLLPELSKRGARPVVVFVDRHQGYASALAILSFLDGAGRDYHLVPVDLSDPPGCFHPKVHLFPRAGVALVGSGNLTPSGCGGNLEAFDVVTAVEDGHALTAVRRFFRSLLEQDGVALDPEFKAAFLTSLQKAADPAPTGTARFFSSLDGALIDQVAKDAEPLEPTTWTRMAAPFHHPRHQTSLALMERLKLNGVEIAADRAPRWTSDSATAGGLEDEKGRVLHAKLIHGVGPESAFLAVGSANLTDAAWSAGNTEAVLVRRDYDPEAWKAFREAIRFVPGAWDPPPPRADAEERLPAIALRWARLDGVTLTASLEELAEPRFRLESGARSQEVMLRRRGDEYVGTTDFIPGQALVLWVVAEGRSESGIVVDQPALLASAGRAGRIRRILQKVDAEMGDTVDRRELITCLADVLAAMQSRAAPAEPSRGGRRSGGSKGGSFQGEQDEVVFADLDLNPVQGRSSQGGGGQSALLQRLRRLVDALVTPRDFELQEQEENNNELRRNDERSDYRTKPNKKLVDEDAELRESFEQLVEHHLSRLRRELADDQPGVVAAYETLLHFGRQLMIKRPKLRAYSATRTLHLLSAAWAIADWPSMDEGWALAGDGPDVGTSRLAVLEAWRSLPASAVSEDDAYLDRCHRILAGLSRFDPATSLEDPNDRALHERLLTHVTRGERGRERLAPLWALEKASLQRLRHPGPESEASFAEARKAARRAHPEDWEHNVFETWRAARTGRGRTGRRVYSPPAGDSCPNCNIRLSSLERSKLSNPSIVVKHASCGVLFAHGMPRELRHG